MLLRPYQHEILDSILANYRNGVRRQVVVAATGTGKSACLSRIPTLMRAELPGKMLVIVHTTELVHQNAEEIRQANPDLRVSIEMANLHADPDADIIVASVQTLGRAGTKRIENFNWMNIDICIADESQHSTCDAYVRIFKAGGFLDAGSRKLLCGFTATPNRSDGRPLKEVYQKIVFNYPIRRGIEEKYLADLIGVRLDTKTLLDQIKTVDGDFNQTQLAEAVDTDERNELIVAGWLREASPRKTICFAVNILHAQHLAAAFQDHGVTAEAVWGVDPERSAKLARHKSGETVVLTNVGVLCEGYNDPSISAVLLAAPTKSNLKFTQCCGRGTRIFQGKENCMILDVVDSTKKHSLVSLPSLLGMPAKLNLKGKSAIASLKILENLAKEFPHLDFSGLEDIDDIQNYIERVNLWDAPYAAEVEQFSKLSWHRGLGDTFILSLPAKERLEIKQNVLGTFNVNGTVKTRTVSYIADSLERAFQEADAIVGQHASEHMVILRRKAGWHSSPATEKQLATLGKLLHGKPIPAGITKGEAAKVIGQEFAKRDQEQVSTPATAPQLRYLHALQRQGLIRSIPEALSKHDAGRLISQAKSAA